MFEDYMLTKQDIVEEVEESIQNLPTNLKEARDVQINLKAVMSELDSNNSLI